MQDASIGIDQGSVVTSREQLTARVEHVFNTHGGPVLIERFIVGREFLAHVCEAGDDLTPDLLPPAEIAFRKGKVERWPVYTFQAKWNEDCDEYKDAPLVAPVELPPELMDRLRDISLRVFRLLGCRDYARLDLRLGENGEFYVIEANPNPYLNSLALVKGLEAVGRTHEWLIVNLMLNAIARGGRARPSSIKVPVGVVSGA
jgi:D-alanine-D-alanine ligase